MSTRLSRQIRQRPLTPSERADAILATIPDADFDALADVAVRLLLARARRRGMQSDQGRSGACDTDDPSDDRT